MSKRNWIVSVSTSNDDPMIFGPYVKQRAEELRDKFNAWVDDHPEVFENHEFIRAGAYPIRNPGIRDMTKEFC